MMHACAIDTTEKVTVDILVGAVHQCVINLTYFVNWINYMVINIKEFDYFLNENYRVRGINGRWGQLINFHKINGTLLKMELLKKQLILNMKFFNWKFRTQWKVKPLETRWKMRQIHIKLEFIEKYTLRKYKLI